MGARTHTTRGGANKYLHGFGNGDVNSNSNNKNDIGAEKGHNKPTRRSYLRDPAASALAAAAAAAGTHGGGGGRNNHNSNNKNNRHNPKGLYPDDVVNGYTLLEENLDTGERTYVSLSGGPNTRHDPWRRHTAVPSVFLVGAGVVIVVVTSAMFWKLISLGSHHHNHHRKLHAESGQSVHRKKKRPVRAARKKKTDEWVEDHVYDAKDEEQLLLCESVRAQNSDLDEANPPEVYYPYQPLQQRRHRKNSSVSAAGTTAVTGTTVATAAPVVVASQTSSQRYYLNQSGSAVIAGGGGTGHTKSPVPAAGKTLVYHRSSNNNNGSHSSSLSYVPPSPVPTVPRLQAQPSIFQSPSAESRTRAMNARHLPATASSFASLTEHASSDDDDAHSFPVDNLLGSFASPQRLLPSHPSKSDVTVASSTDGDGTPRQNLLLPDYVESTPRVVNGRQNLYSLRQARSTDEPLSSHGVLHNVAHRQGRSRQSSLGSQSDLQFASPPMPSPRNLEPIHAPSIPIPFVPNLDVAVANRQRPPSSMHMDDLHIYQLMESGANPSHWKEQVARESNELENQVFPADRASAGLLLPSAQSANMKDRVMAASGLVIGQSYSDEDSIPSGDPRKCMNHKRRDLTTATNAAASLQGDIAFDELKLIDVIGGGGFGQVWKAMWMGTPVAVKVLTGSAQSQSVPRAVLEEFAAEINLLKGMRHPNICLYMGASLEPPNRAIITELAANGSLWDALRLPLTPPYEPCNGLSRIGWPSALYQPDTRHGAPPGQSMTTVVPPKGSWHWILVKRVACGAARGMAYLHSGKPAILHRDLKSANILLDESYVAKVCDFGLSRLKAQEQSMTGNCGTVQWMAPEVLANQSYNEKADVFSYGIICWELLTRQCPYDKMSPIQCALAVLNKNQRPEIPKWCPPPLQALIRACLKKDPEERPTFVQILQALDAMP